jgi:signal peptidase I
VDAIVEPEPAAGESSGSARSSTSLWLRVCRDALRGAALMLLVHAFVVQVSVVRGHSMEPCLHDGDRLVVDRLTCSVSGVDRFDVIVLGNPRDPSVDYVKRVVGLPGDRVRLVDGTLWVNGVPAPEAFAPIHDFANTAEHVVPSGYVWVLGDNRPISCDSRDFGLVEHSLLKGRVRARFWPLGNVAIF